MNKLELIMDKISLWSVIVSSFWRRYSFFVVGTIKRGGCAGVDHFTFVNFPYFLEQNKQ